VSPFFNPQKIKEQVISAEKQGIQSPFHDSTAKRLTETDMRKSHILHTQQEPKVIVLAVAAKKAFSSEDLFLMGALALMSLFPLLLG